MEQRGFCPVLVLLPAALLLNGCPAMVVTDFPTARSLAPAHYGGDTVLSGGTYEVDQKENLYNFQNQLYGSQTLNGSTNSYNLQDDVRRGSFFKGLELGAGMASYNLVGDAKYQWLGYGNPYGFASAFDVQEEISQLSRTYSAAMVASERCGPADFHAGARAGDYVLFGNPGSGSPPPLASKLSDGFDMPSTPFFDLMAGVDLWKGFLDIVSGSNSAPNELPMRFQFIYRIISQPSHTYASNEDFYFHNFYIISFGVAWTMHPARPKP